MTRTGLRRPVAKLSAFGIALAVVFGAAYAVGVALPDALDDSPPPAHVQDAPVTTQGMHP